MLRRALPAAAAALTVCALTAVAAPRASAPAPRTAPVALHGVAATWSEGRSTIALAEALPTRGPRFARRAVSSARRLVVRLRPGTVIVGEDEDGHRARLEPADLFAALDEAGEVLAVEAAGRLTVPRGRTVRPAVAARTVILHLPGLDDDLDADDPAGLPDEPPADEEPATDPDDPAPED